MTSELLARPAGYLNPTLPNSALGPVIDIHGCVCVCVWVCPPTVKGLMGACAVKNKSMMSVCVISFVSRDISVWVVRMHSKQLKKNNTLKATLNK